MKLRDTETPSTQRQDKQLQGIALEAVMEKRRLDQALNAKEFAVCAGVSYSTARSWFHLPGFPVFHGVIFWQDFVQWRARQNGLQKPSLPPANGDADEPWAPRRVGYPLSGCVPAEPDAVFPAILEFSEARGEKKVASCPAWPYGWFYHETAHAETRQDAPSNYPQSRAAAQVF